MASPKSGSMPSLVEPGDPTAPDPADSADPGEVERAKARQRQTQTGKYGSASVEPFKSDPNALHWIEVTLTDDEGEPIPGERYRITMPDGTVNEGRLDAEGCVRIEGIPDAGDCKVTFPDLDKGSWKKGKATRKPRDEPRPLPPSPGDPAPPPAPPQPPSQPGDTTPPPAQGETPPKDESAGTPGEEAKKAVLVKRAGNAVPHFQQSGQTWSSRTLGTGSTLSAQGCAVCSAAMVLKYFGRDLDPGVLDQYLDDNSGYLGNAVRWDVAFKCREPATGPRLGGASFVSDASSIKSTLDSRIDQDLPTIVHVDYGSDADTGGNHFVVVVGRTADGEWIMNDPASSAGNGAADPSNDNIIQKTTRKGGYTIVKIVTFNVT